MEWHRKLRDTNAMIAIDRRVSRMELGNFGDHKFCRDGIWEIRIDVVRDTESITPLPDRR